MRDKAREAQLFTNASCVYGPVKSRRFGMSLGIDPIFEISTCSFNCIYCQLGDIQRVTRQVRTFVPTARVVEDFKKYLASRRQTPIDVITYSGSGEPTLAANLGEIAGELKVLHPASEQIILTNATELHRPEVRENLHSLDRVIVKVDAPNEELFQKINRPAEGVTLKGCLEGILKLKETYPGTIEVQTMFMPINRREVHQLAEILNAIGPAAVQLNTPERPYPLEWHRENRGNHQLVFDYEARPLKVLLPEKMGEVRDELAGLTGLSILSVGG